MLMYFCLDCEELFKESKIWVEKHGLDSPPYEEWDGCPFCGGRYIDAIFCDCCGNPIIGDYVTIVTGDNICENCFTLKNIED